MVRRTHSSGKICTPPQPSPRNWEGTKGRDFFNAPSFTTDGPALPDGRAVGPPVQGTPPGREVAPPAQPSGEFPLHITAAKLEADQAAGTVTFTGQVKATYGDSILYSDQLRVFFQKKPEAAKGKAAAPAAACGQGHGRPIAPGGAGRRQDRPHRGHGLRCGSSRKTGSPPVRRPLIIRSGKKWCWWATPNYGRRKTT